MENGQAFEVPFCKLISLEVGSDGIIGRRVSLFHNSGKETNQPSSTQLTGAVVKGIVGFNFYNLLRLRVRQIGEQRHCPFISSPILLYGPLRVASDWLRKELARSI